MKTESHRLSFEPFLENRRSFLLLRWLVIILASYLTLFGNLQSEQFIGIAAVVLAFSLSNVVAALLPLRLFVASRSRYLLAVADALFIGWCLHVLRVEGPPIHFPFIGIFLLALVSRDLRVVLFALFVISILLGVFSVLNLFGFGTVVPLEQFLALSLFFVVAIFYVFLIDRFDRDAKTSMAMLEEKKNSEIMVEITRTLSGSMNPEEIYRVIVTRLSEATDGGECLIVRVADDKAIVVASSADTDPFPEIIPLSSAQDLREAYQEKRTVSTTRAVPGTDRAALSTLTIPMVTRGECAGLIHFRGDRFYLEPSSTTLHFFEVVASTAANAMRNVQMFEEMKHMARTDFLTGLPNHRYFQSALSREMGRAQRHNHPLSLLVIDLDFLKGVNDRFGHPAGDSVIRAMGGTIRSTCREIDFAARYGGEEFVVILPETDLQGAIQVGERVRKRIEETDLGQVGRVTASVGVANYPVNATSKEDLIRVADQALYVAKNGGRNQVAHFRYQLTTM